METRGFIALLLLVLIVAPMIPVSAITTTSSSQENGGENVSPVIVPVWQGAGASAVAFSADERYVFVWTSSFGWTDGKYVLVLDYEVPTYIRVYDVETGRLIDEKTGTGLYVFDDGELRLLWRKDSMGNSMRGYLFHDKVVYVTTNGVVYVYDLQGNLLFSVDTGIDHVDSGFAVTDDGTLIVVGPGMYATFPAPVVVVNLLNGTVMKVVEADSRVLRLAIDKDRGFIIIGEQDGDLRIVAFNGTQLWSIHRPAGIASMAYNGRYLAVGDRDGWMALYVIDNPENPSLVTNMTDPDAGYEHGVYAPTSLSNSGIGGMDRLSRIIVYHNPYNGYTWFLHVPTKTWYKYTGGTVNVVCFAYPAAVSPSGTYVYAGQTLFMIVYQDVQAYKPRIRFWGTMTFKREYHDLNTPLILGAPARDWHLYFYSGRLTIKRIYVEPIPVNLVEDTDIVNGRLSKMLAKGLISAETFYTENAEVRELEVIPGSEVADILREEGIETIDNYVATLSLTHFTPPPYFWEGHAWTGTVIHIPVDKPINVYDDIMLQISTSIHTTSLLYDKNKRALAILGVPVEIGGGIVGAAAYSRIANRILIWYASRHGISIPVAAVTTSQAVAKVVGVVGIAVAIWGGIDAVLVEWGGLGDVNVQNWIVIAPVVEDRLGNKYTAIQLILPLEESDNVQKYYDILSKYFKDLGYTDIGFRVTYPCRTWDEYRTLLVAGYSPQVKLDDLIEETVAAKHGLDVDELKIVGVDVLVVTAVRAKETFWEWLFGLGGVDFDTVTFIGATTITVKGRLKAGTITDPSQIATLLSSITVNDKEYVLIPGVDGAYTDFSFALGTEKLIIDFGKRTGYFADLVLEIRVVVKKDFQPLEDFAYTATLHYDWEGTLIRIERIEFTDMPYPMYRAERTFIYRYGNFTNDITEAFELSKAEPNNESPTGYLYYYVTRENTKFIDPANGGIMMPCKTYIFNYYYREPPDAGIVVYLNGTKVTSTLAHHATVVINSTAVQEVTYSITFNVKYYEGLAVKTLVSKSFTDKMAVPANGTAYKIFDITPYVDAAINFMKSQNKPAFVEISAKIIDAKYNYYKDNDEYTVVYYPPLSLPPPMPPGNFTVTFEVVDAINYTAIPGASIVAAYGENVTESSLVYTVTTNESGRAQLVLQGGVWTFKVSRDGYYDAYLTAPIYNDTSIRFYLVPSIAENFTQPVLPINGSTTPVVIDNTPYFWLGVQVLWANGLPFEGANVSVYKNATGELIAALTTNGTGMAWYLLPAYEVYNITVHAVNPYNTSLVYDASRVLNITAHTIISFNVTWTPEVPELSKRYRMVVYAYDALTNEPIENVTVIVSKGHVGYLQRTGVDGAAEFYLPFLGKWSVIGLHPDYEAVNRTVELFENETAINLPMYPKNISMPVLPPVNGTYTPVVYQGRNYYWLSVQVLWKDGYPFHGANVSVYNLTDGSLIFQRYTNGTGFVHFLIPENASIKVTVNATHPENASLAFYIERELNMTQHWYVVFTVPWESRYWQPEVWLKEVRFVIHRGQGYYFGNVSHLVLLTIWTNKPQNVTVLIGLYNVTGGTWVVNKTVTLSLAEGLNTFFEWVDVNASAGGYFKVFANITSWEYDTNTVNNWGWSNTVFLKPMVDIQVFVLWRPVEQKQPWTILPEDIIEIDIGVRMPINTTAIPAKLSWRVEKYDLRNLMFEIERGSEEELRVVQPGMVWRNVTVRVPWTSRIMVFVNVTHEWEDFDYNNYVNVTIPIDPDVRIVVVEKPTVVMEGSVFRVVVDLTSNVEPGKGIGWVSVVDNTTATLLRSVEITLEPQKTLEIEVRAPENPATFWVIRAPTTTHYITTQFTGYDMYTENNVDEFTVVVVSYQWLTIIAVIVVAIAVIAALKALTHTIHDIRRKTRRFVKRKSFLTESIWDLREEEEKRGFVKKKD